MGHVCPSGVTPRFSHGLHDCGEQAATDTARPLACLPAAPATHRAPPPLLPSGKPRRQCRAAPWPAAPPTHHTGLPRRADDTADKRFACFAIAERHPVAQPGPPPPTPAAKPISSDPQHHPTFLGRSHPTRSTDPTPSVLSGCPPYPTTPFSASGPFAFAVFHTSPEFWMVLQFLAPVFDTRLEFWAVFPSPRPEKCLRTQTIEPLTWGFPIPSTTAPAIMASKPPRRFWTPHRSPHRRFAAARIGAHCYPRRCPPQLARFT